MPTGSGEKVLTFWFETLSANDWYKKSEALDRRITEQFETTLERIVAGETWQWRDTAEGRLAEIIVLDQFSRNMFRDTPAAFGNDSLALILAQEAIRCGADRELTDERRAFLYMPFMHSESRIIHEQALELFADLPNLSYEKKHKAIIDEFGRYPYRNDILGRTYTPAERRWLESNSGF